MSHRTFSLVAGLIFLVMAVIHILRLAFKWEVILNGWSVPTWVSAVALLVAAYLAFEGLKLSRRSWDLPQRVDRPVIPFWRPSTTCFLGLTARGRPFHSSR